MQTEELEGNLFQDKVLGLLSKVPKSADKLYIGPVRIHPSFEFSETYDDNVFNSASRTNMPHNDSYDTYKPGISLVIPLRNHLLNFDYGFEILDFHRKYKIRTPEQDRVNRSRGVAAEFNFEKDFSISLIGSIPRENPAGLPDEQISQL